MRLVRKNEILDLYTDGFHYKNKRKKSEIIIKKRNRKQTYDICFIKRNHKKENIKKEDLALISIDKKTNSSCLHISLTYSGMKVIHEIVEYIENEKKVKKRLKTLR